MTTGNQDVVENLHCRARIIRHFIIHIDEDEDDDLPLPELVDLEVNNHSSL